MSSSHVVVRSFGLPLARRNLKPLLGSIDDAVDSALHTPLADPTTWVGHGN